MKKPFVLIAAIVAVVGLGATVAVAKDRTATSPTAPLTLGARAHQEPGGSLRVYAYTNHDSTIVVSGRKIKKTKTATEPLPPEAVRYWASIRVRLKHPSRVDRPG